ncbi:hypothetical protein GQ53DRAFT_846473 [Thozetella sp. PMI_491]|nr:hypothetical protein GQ53DRAFT_846473 [Thozetella sp. PMI_491]
MAPSHIPLFYHLIFLVWEPLSAVGGGLQLLTKPGDFLNTFVPPTVATPDPLQRIIFNELGAAYISIGAIQGLLLTCTKDLRIWELLNICLLVCWDTILLYSYWCSLSAQGRLDWRDWRPEDWTVVLITVVVGATRLAFAAGIGLRRARAHVKPAAKKN